MDRKLEPEDFSRIKALPDEALEALFREEVTKSNLSDPELLRSVFREEQSRGLWPEADDAHAWEIFSTRLQDIDEDLTAQTDSIPFHELPESADSEWQVSGKSPASSSLRPTGRYRFLRRLAFIAAVLALLLAFGSFTASAVGYNIWEQFYSWTESTFFRQSNDTASASATVSEDLVILL